MMDLDLFSSEHASLKSIAVVAILSLALYMQFRNNNARIESLENGNKFIPTPPGAYPILGHMLQFLRPDYHRLMLGFANDLGPVYRVK